MKIGFTGTQQGMTPEQKHKLMDLLKEHADELHHGDCIGADEQAHGIATSYGVRRVVHPPENANKRAWCLADLVLPPREYLARNHDIVDACDLLIACPAQAQEVLRSGTWATVRFARKSGKLTIVIYPDGKVGH